jgi:hypothetical protein
MAREGRIDLISSESGNIETVSADHDTLMTMRHKFSGIGAHRYRADL